MKNMTDLKNDASNDWDGFAKELTKESPRAAVVLGASFLDIRLRELIANFLVDSPVARNDLLGKDGADTPIGSFSSRTKFAYCLGLLTKDEYDDLNLIRKIRNGFAHKLHDLSFDDPTVVEWCKALKTAKALGVSNVSPIVLFRLTVAFLATQIAMAAQKAILNRLVVPGKKEMVDRYRAAGFPEKVLEQLENPNK